MSKTLTKKQFVSDQEVRWCPGCGDYSILNAVQQAFARLGRPREQLVVVSGIGCSSRFPYYMETYGFHSIHGRAPTLATGIKGTRPDLSVWVVTGDGDGLSIGGNHLLHALRRNVGVKILLFNNQIYGLTKGQYSPTSELGKVTKSSPLGSLDRPVNPVCVALAAEATFVARTADIYGAHLQEIIQRMAEHEGSAFLEILQNCNIFNDGAWVHLTDKSVRADRNLMLEHGKPMIFGKNRDLGLRLLSGQLEVVRLGEDGVTEEDIQVHDEKGASATAYLLSRLKHPRFPVPMGVFRCVEYPSFESGMWAQVATAQRQNPPDLQALLQSGDVWEVT